MSDFRLLNALGLGLSLTLWAVSAPGQTVLEGPGFPFKLDSVEVSATPVAGRVHMLQGAGGNIGIFAGDDGVLMIDDELAALTERILSAIKSISDKPIRFLINTHFHGDHTGANENYGGAGVTIVAHDNVRRTLSKSQYIAAIKTRFAALKPAGLPIITFNQEMTFHLDGEEIFVFHVPRAHTDGDSMIYFRGSDVILTGDVYQRSGYPVFDRGNGGSFEGLIAGWDRVLPMIGEDTKILQGHGGISNRAALQEARDKMVTFRDRIAAAIAAGKTLEQVIAEKPTDGLDTGWPPRPLTKETIIEWVYAELSG